MAAERLQKIIAQAGLCARRDAEQLIREGRVTVNGRVAALGDKADLDADAVKVDGKRLRAAEHPRYILLHKPRGVMTTTDDPGGRPTVIALLGRRVKERVYPVGRLDFQSEGLLLLTNDGELALKVGHPRHGVLKEYRAKVKGIPTEADRAKVARGTVVDGRRVVPRELELLRETPSGGNSWWRVVVGEGRTHEVRELFRRAGFPVQRLIRTAIGPISDPALRAGNWRDLRPEEVELLRTGRTARRRTSDEAPGTRVHPKARRLRSGAADRGSPARAGGERDRQARVERKPTRDRARGPRRDS